MPQNDPPECADHFEACIIEGDFLEKILPGESVFEFLDQPLWTGLSQKPLCQTPPPRSFRGLNDSPPPPPCDIPLGRCSFTGPWTVTRSSLRMLRRVAAFCRPLRPVLLLVSLPRLRSPVVGVPGRCWLRRMPFVH